MPSGYGEDFIILMVKDPWWVYAYWEIQPSTERSIRSQLLPNEVAGLQTILRVHDVTGVDFPSRPANHAFDIGLSGLATNWFIHTNAPDRSFVVDIGLLTASGRFLLLARSNRVTVPRFGPSDAIDEEWMITDDAYWKLFGAASSIGAGASPGSLTAQKLFSGGWSSPGSLAHAKAHAVQGFWCRVNTDLVIHGAVEPKSRVSIQGQPATVRRDGTFTLRLALPTGSQTITVEATSPDGRQTKTITPIVTLAWSGPLADAPSVPHRTGADQSGGSAR
jgi:hypothetical protein